MTREPREPRYVSGLGLAGQTGRVEGLVLYTALVDTPALTQMVLGTEGLSGDNSDLL